MATRIKPTRKGLYQDDFYVWTRRQAECLRARRYDELDLENLIEEVAELGDTAKKSARRRTRTIIEHLLKLQHSPAVGPRAGWRDTIRTQRDDLLDDLTPTLRRELEDDQPGMLRAINLDDQHGIVTKEIDNVRSNGFLPPKLPTEDPASAQVLPKQRLRFGGVVAHLTGTEVGHCRAGGSCRPLLRR